MSTTTRELSEQAKFLRNAAPQEFAQFCASLERYTNFMIDSLVNAPGDLAVAQGRAQQCVKLWRVLEGIKNG